MLTLIAAIGKNNELGKNNDLVWRLPADQKHFRDRTALHTMIMGRKTFESLPGALPKRRHIVITRDKDYKAEGGEVVHSLAEAIDLAKQGLTQEPARPHEDSGAGGEVFIIGGAEIFKQAMELDNARLDITHIYAEDKDANVFFPEIIPVIWNETKHEEHEADKDNPIAYTFSIYEKFQ